jgi:hypothetical protein
MNRDNQTFEDFIDSIPEHILIPLKEKYDIDFKKYWTSGTNPPKFGIISMGEFRNRLKNIDFYKKYGLQ